MIKKTGMRDCLESRIERLDAEILSRLLKRFQLVRDLTQARHLKKKDPAYLPDYEAKVIRRLLAGCSKDVDVVTLAKIWREIMSAGMLSERHMPIAVYTKERANDMMTLAKDYFGIGARYLACVSTAQAIQKVSQDEAGAALLPLFEQAEDSWWTFLSSSEQDRLSIVAKVPFVKHKTHLKSNEAFVVAKVASEATGRDKSLFAIEMRMQTSMASLKTMLEEVGLKVESVWPAYNLSRVYLFAVEVDGFIAADDDRLILFHAKNQQNIQLLRRIGGYAAQEVLAS